MIATRLETVSRELTDLIARADVHQQRAIALAVAKLAIERTNLREDIVNEALRSLEKGAYRDDALLSALKALVDELDDKYLSAHDEYERGNVDEAIYRDLFSKFTAASSVMMAFDDDPFKAAAEALYEAGAAIGDEEPEAIARAILMKDAQG